MSRVWRVGRSIGLAPRASGARRNAAAAGCTPGSVVIALLVGLLGLLLYLTILWDGFQYLVLPRTVGGLRLSHPFFRTSWTVYLRVIRGVPSRWHDSLLGYYGPASLIVLIAMWAVGLIVCFALLQTAAGVSLDASGRQADFGTALYFSGTTFFTLGLGDVTPHSGLSRVLTVVEVGTGLGFLAVVIGYLPVLYQSFVQRETLVALLAARSGSPPTTAALVRRYGQMGHPAALAERLLEGERWVAETLESILAHPVLSYYRSQHLHHSWVAALAIVTDASALSIVGLKGVPPHSAHLAFDMGRHSVMDLCRVYSLFPKAATVDRLPSDELARLRAMLSDSDIPLADGAEADRRLAALRQEYEPYLQALSDYLRMPLPRWVGPEEPGQPQRSSPSRSASTPAGASTPARA
jgi:hypothetical protein